MKKIWKKLTKKQVHKYIREADEIMDSNNFTKKEKDKLFKAVGMEAVCMGSNREEKASKAVVAILFNRGLEPKRAVELRDNIMMLAIDRIEYDEVE